MRLKNASFFALLVLSFGYLLWAAGCSEESPTAETDQVAPVVSIEAPVAQGVYGATVQDSIDILVHASDNDAVVKIEVWIVFHDDTTGTKLADLTDPDSTDAYSYHWRIGGISNGSTGSLYAVATDRAGNQGASEKVRVLIINQSEVGPPIANFFIVPNQGTVLTLFTFDPSVTVDALNEPIDVLVRWDFDGDGSWDIDTTAGYKASDKVTHSYVVPDTYLVVMEAFNNYYSIEQDDPGRMERELVVKPPFGDPRPPEAEEFVRIAPGTYPFAAIACPAGQSCGDTDADETLADTFYVGTSNAFLIDKYEVSNGLYVDFLNAAMDVDTVVSYDLTTKELRALRNNRVMMMLDKTLTRVKFQLIDSTFWVDDRYRRHPVTGVTWYGAFEYAAFYGLRLPSEVEWEIAARGQNIGPGHLFPWSPMGAIDSTYANFRYSGDPYEQSGTTGYTTPVGAYNGTVMGGGFPTSFAESPMGTYDQAGNVAEWTGDRYSSTIYGEHYQTYLITGQPPVDPRGPAEGEGYNTYVLRGGSYQHWPWELRLTDRREAYPYEKAAWIGFRTAYTEF